ncbi:hypothetical protein ES705_29795 [subsurface metagenome]
MLFGSNPDSGIVEVSKFVESPNQQQDETHENSENESNENKSRVDLADEKEQNPQPDVSKFEFCTSCGSDDIRVNGNQFYCFECDVNYEVTPKGTKVVSMNPVQEVTDLKNRVEQLENDVDDLNGNSDEDKNSGKDKNSGVLFSLFGIDFGFVAGDEDEDDGDLVSVGAGKNPGSDDDDDDDEPDGFLSW